MRKSVIMYLFFAALILVWSCDKPAGDDPKDESSDKPKTEEKETKKTGIKGIDDFVEKMEDLNKEMEEGKEYEVVDFRLLKDMLPEQVGPLPRTSATGEKNSGMGFTISETRGKYTLEDTGQRVEIEIKDMGSMKGWAGLAAWGWTMAEVDKETDTGYERTMEYKGHKGFEEYDNESQDGKIELFVAKRYMVSVKGWDVPMDLIKEGLDEVPVGDLEDIKDAGLVAE
ncbi:MAG: hypothetical protein KJN64_13655 [Ignavibacteria bacterium]|nr:hypothetical protein [Ignavibacteria bacterium]MBT8382798.1 hypothetical protein [Ignavibacteria bacterium]MBT8392685.1 hypothetical protein [Ignavibacteria bacterium]NNJ52535.1 hypothetical protein [Ignavibacteriaceae bacterium]NNL21980.1 hypothetical protein [Ignavibacteriaceae bacterium]